MSTSRLQVLRRWIASLEAVKVEFFNQDSMDKGMYDTDERAIEQALAALRSYEPREARS